MKFLIDAHLPRRLVYQLRAVGYDATHTLDLPRANRTTDTEVNDFSIREQRVVITKDADFVDSFIVQRKPYKLLLVSTGNITNAELEVLFLQNIKDIANTFLSHDFIEIDRMTVIIHV